MSDEQTTAPLAFIDTETDGVHPTRRPWEIAIVRREADGTEREWCSFVDIDLSTSDPFGLRIGRFYDRHPLGRSLSGVLTENEKWTLDAVPPKHVARTVAQLTHGAHLVGAVPNFDAEVFDGLLRAHDLLPGWHYHLIDVENLAVGFLAERGQAIRPPWKSDELTEALGVEPGAPEEKHTALGDVRWAMRIYDRVMGGTL